MMLICGSGCGQKRLAGGKGGEGREGEGGRGEEEGMENESGNGMEGSHPWKCRMRRERRHDK